MSDLLKQKLKDSMFGISSLKPALLLSSVRFAPQTGSKYPEISMSVSDLARVREGPSKLQATRPPLPSEIFTGRVEYLEKMRETFSIQASSTERRKQRRFVLYGMGGAGKTELALKFLDQNRNW